MARKMKPHKPPRRKSPILEKYSKNPGGPNTPGAKKKKKKKTKKKKKKK